jgi:hypothetical protein
MLFRKSYHSLNKALLGLLSLLWLIFSIDSVLEHVKQNQGRCGRNTPNCCYDEVEAVDLLVDLLG